MTEFHSRLEKYEEQQVLTPRQGKILRQFYESYTEGLRQGGHFFDDAPPITLQFLKLIIKQIQTPYPFQFYHQRTIKPDNYFTFGLDLVRPLINFEKSVLLGQDNLARIAQQIKQGENCVFYANHQTEPDPQAINLMLEKDYPDIGANMLFVAGHRVISDPIAVPFSQGRNMLCIYSRKHMDHEPENKADKLMHNRRAMHELVRQLTAGGLCVYMAPSGGRDRVNDAGHVPVAPFDRDAIELFVLMAQEAKTPTHFYPLSLVTHDLLPPPPVVEKELGEDRTFNYTPIGLAFGEELKMKEIANIPGLDKKGQREVRRDTIFKKVCEGYETLLRMMRNH